MATVNELVRDRSITRRVYLEGLTVREAKKIQRETARASREIAGRIKTHWGERSQKFFNAQVKALEKISNEAMDKVIARLDADVVNLAVAESRYQSELLQRSMPIKWDTATASPTQLLSAVRSRPYGGKILKDWYKEAKGGAFSRLKADLRSGYLQGLTTPQMIRKLHQSSLAKTRAGTVAMVRTALTHTASVARDYTYAENADLIKGIQWLSTLDTKTSEICIGLDGKIFALNDGPRPPAHTNCRSTTIPITRSWKELGLALQGPQAAATRFDGWTGTREHHLSGMAEEAVQGSTNRSLGKKQAGIVCQGRD